MKVVNVKQMRAIEKASDEKGLSYARMMENAGRATAQAIRGHLGEVNKKKILILVGPGNNGGDGLVAARYLHQEKSHVVLYIWKRKVEGDENFRLTQEAKIPCVWAEDDKKFARLKGLLNQADIIVDALLGTGVSRPIEGDLKEILLLTRQEIERRKETSEPAILSPVPDLPEGPLASISPRPMVVAVDVPTGLDCDTGEIDPSALPADLTVTFGFPKVGQFLFPGAEYIGQLFVADIEIPLELASEVETELLTAEMVKALLPARPLGAHKGTFGKALVIAGSVNYTGAAYLAGAAATRVGAGLVTMGLARGLHPILAAKLSETTFLLLPEDMGALVPEAVEVLAEEGNLEGYRAMLLGPGLGRDKKTVEFVSRLLVGKASKRIGFLALEEESAEKLPLPHLVIDADGLNVLAELSEWWRWLPEGSILTPHPGELSRLSKLSIAEIESDRLGVARRLSAQWKQVLVLKGAYTLIASPEGRVAFNPFANPGLATAGSGDVLAGAIAGFRAQGLEPWVAAAVGAYVHGLAGELVRKEKGDAGMVAGDLLPALPQAIKLIRSQVPGTSKVPGT